RGTRGVRVGETVLVRDSATPEVLMETLASTRRALPGVAELVLAAPQHLVGDTVRLRVVPGGFATTVGDDVRLDRTTVQRAGVRVPVDGETPRGLAEPLGLAGP